MFYGTGSIFVYCIEPTFIHSINERIFLSLVGLLPSLVSSPEKKRTFPPPGPSRDEGKLVAIQARRKKFVAALYHYVATVCAVATSKRQALMIGDFSKAIFPIPFGR